jgi:hypothetical protein
MNVLILASHEIAEYDDLRMFTDLGIDAFVPGGYQNPPEHDQQLRPPLDAPVFPELIEACENRRREYGDPGHMIDWAKAALPDEVIDWADVIICHHFPERWIAGQWDRISHKRVIWRTCGQSNPDLEAYMGQLVPHGLQIIRYSPKERNLPNFAGEDALIRFGKYPSDYGPWTGEVACVANVTQHMLDRGDATGLSYYLEATKGLYVRPAGPGSEKLRGVGSLSHPDMLDYLRRCRVYLYTGTQPASYTLGLMEAMLTGIPVVSIGPKAFGQGWIGDVFEGHEITRNFHDDPMEVRAQLDGLLQIHELAAAIGSSQRDRAIDLFDVATVGEQWREFLS